ncbi:metallophosphoesterase [bacterium]|nr:metallophosphoesterase [bacterium]
MIRLYATHVEPNQLKTREIAVETNKVSQPLRILHISDIQSAQVGSFEHRVFDRIAQLNPELIVFTGDLLQPQAPATIDTELPKIVSLMQTLQPPQGIVGVYGNIDDTKRANGVILDVLCQAQLDHRVA